MSAKAPPYQPVEVLSDDSESDLENEIGGCVKPDLVDETQKMGDAVKEITIKDITKARKKHNKALRRVFKKKYDRAIEIFTEAIEIDPCSALLFVKRAYAYLKNNKPNACIKDCTRALELVPSLTTAFKYRGRAYSCLGKWEIAVEDLRKGYHTNFDIPESKPYTKKMIENKLEQERKLIAYVERKALEAHAKASTPRESNTSLAPKADNFYTLFNDAEFVAAFADPEVFAAVHSILSNPANLSQYQSNPKLVAQITKLSEKLAKTGSFSRFSDEVFSGFGEAAVPSLPHLDVFRLDLDF